MNSAARFQRIDDLFRAARALPAHERAAYIDEQCAGDPDLRADVLALLAEDDDPRGALDQPALGREIDLHNLALDHDAQRHIPLPESIGGFTIIRVLGRGGMGIVYEAKQSNPDRTVALKVIHPGLASPSTLRRFRHEVQLLGRLQHPGIAPIYEAGTFDDAGGPQPYFAMELVRGEPLLQHAQRDGLSTTQRLDLIARICDIVHHAHQRGVIHRDLKPGNILVDEDANPRILDFGVARATDADVQVTTIRTDIGQLIGTVPYMSPEQVAGDPNRLDTRSDVYALGVIAYQLLTGRLPYDVKDKPVYEVVHIIRETEPTSIRLTNRALRGDVETIIRKALEKDPARRYQSASEFAADVRRHLGSEPIHARPPDTWYQLTRFARRNKPIVAGVIGVLIALTLGLVGASLSLARALDAERAAAHDRDRAERQAAIAQSINEFLIDDLLGAVDADENLDADIMLRTVLDAASPRIEERFRSEPTIEADVRATIGRSYRKLGALDQAEQHLARALELNTHIHGADHPTTLVSMSTLANLFSIQGRFDEAAQLFAASLSAERRLSSENSASLINSLTNLAGAYRALGRHEEAFPLYEEAMERARATHAPDDLPHIIARLGLAGVYRDIERYDQAEILYLDALDALRTSMGRDHPRAIRVMNSLSILYNRTERHDKAIATLEEAFLMQEARYGPAHHVTIAIAHNLGSIARETGALDDAERILTRALDLSRESLGETHHGTLNITNELAKVYRDTNRTELARALLHHALGVASERLSEDHHRIASIRNTLASLTSPETAASD